PAIFVGCLAAYLVNPTVSTLSHIIRIPRLTIVMAAIIIFGSVVGLTLVLGMPSLIAQIKEILLLAPDAYSNGAKWVSVWLMKLNEYLIPLGLPEIQSHAAIQGLLSGEHLTKFFQTTMTTILSSVPGLISFGVSVTIAPLVMFLCLQYFDETKLYFVQILPKKHLPAVKQIFLRLAAVLKSVIIGQFYVALTLCFLYGIGFEIIGLKAGFTVGIIAGIGRLIPLMDMILSAVLSSIIILSTGGASISLFVGVAIVIAVVGIIDAALITPKLMGSSVGVHPIVILCTVLAISALLGFWGALLAIPLLAMVKVCGLIVVAYYKKWQTFD
ncbi:MAG: AI-2E family transporter, partial [Proteobacteria bacterium]|nr:AI-2E family transporter [Pseudomonadota bacterium]